jgi:hypothetical protein
MPGFIDTDRKIKTKYLERLKNNIKHIKSKKKLEKGINKTSKSHNK